VPSCSQPLQRYRRHVDGGTHYTMAGAQGGTCMEVETYKLPLSGASLPTTRLTVLATSLIPAVPIQDGWTLISVSLLLMKRYWSRLLALVLVVVIGLTGCSNSSPGGLSGDYSQDTLAVLNTIKLALRCQKIHRIKHRLRQKRVKINDFTARYRRDSCRPIPSLQCERR